MWPTKKMGKGKGVRKYGKGRERKWKESEVKRKHPLEINVRIQSYIQVLM